MKIDKRIQQAIDYNVKEIIINKDTYKSLSEETKTMLKQHKVKITFDEMQKEFMCKFEQEVHG